MKKIFTLIAGLLLTGGTAFGQAKWTSVINNGDLEGEDVSNFWAKDCPEDASVEEGPGRIIAEPGNESNHVLVLRMDAEAELTDRYACQFWLVASEEIGENKMLKISFKYKISGETAGHVGTQCHNINRGYVGYNTFGEFDVPTEWTNFEWEGECPENFGSFVLDLWTDQNKGKEIYLDDFSMEIKDGIPPKELEGWFNVVKSGGIIGEDIYQYNWNVARIHGKNNPYWTISAIQNDGNGTVPCPIVNDPIDGQPAYSVTTTVATEWRDTTINIDGTDKSPVPYFVRKTQDGQDSLEVLKGYTTQLFIGGSHIFKKGEKYQFKMKMRATQETSASAQIHYTPGDYKHWQFLEGSIKPNEDWQDYSYEGEITNDQAGTTTIAFNLNETHFNDQENLEPITYYFRDIEFCVNSAEILEADRVLAGDTVTWAAPVKSTDPTAGINMPVDLTNAVQALGFNSAKELFDSGKFKVLIKGEEDAIEPYDISELDYYINAEGLYDDQEGINVFCDVDNVEGNEVTFTLYNTSIDTDAKTDIATKIYFVKYEDAEPIDAEHVKRAWDYELNIKIQGEETQGVVDVKAADKGANAIYDLSGRRVVKPAKGLYIQNSKKIFVK